MFLGRKSPQSLMAHEAGGIESDNQDPAQHNNRTGYNSLKRYLPDIIFHTQHCRGAQCEREVRQRGHFSLPAVRRSTQTNLSLC